MPVRVRWRSLAPPLLFAFRRTENGQALGVRQVCSRILWRNLTLSQRLAAISLIVFWPLAMMGNVPLHLYRYGAGVRNASGKSRLRQCLDQVALIFRHRLAPKHYYRFRLYRPDLLSQAEHVLMRNQTDGFVYPLLQAAQNAKAQPLRDKLGFAEFCAANGLPHVPTILAFARRKELRPSRPSKEPSDDIDLFVKPIHGSRGTRAELWRHTGGRQYRSADGRQIDRQGLLAHVAALSKDRSMLVQPALRNHPALLDLTSGALCTMRLVSWRNEAGEFEVTNAILRMPVDPASSVDNFHAGGIAAPIDLATGTLGRATDLGQAADIVWHDVHPFTGAAITGRALPMWRDTLDLAKRAHRAFHRHIVVGWDIAVLETGPCLIEGNESPGVGTLQRAAGVPLGNQRFGQIMAFHLRSFLDC